MIQAILTDIEGTTSSLSFVKDVLFPYARARLAEYCRAHDLSDILAAVAAIEGQPDLNREAMIEILLRWSDEDRKIGPLKQLQGLIWQAGYEQGDYQGHVYEDAYLALQRWQAKGVRLFVYSSGSVAAQKLLFGYSVYGDLTPWFDGFFDTTTGGKLDASSYTAIAQSIHLKPEQILFLSDHPAELQVAQAAGLLVAGFDRQEPGGWPLPETSGYPVVDSFDDLDKIVR